MDPERGTLKEEIFSTWKSSSSPSMSNIGRMYSCDDWQIVRNLPEIL